VRKCISSLKKSNAKNVKVISEALLKEVNVNISAQHIITTELASVTK
jgi:hypothetical protein